MKKKGLLISTIVMVVVLVASLTTATYAWFTVANTLTVKGFDLSVAPNTAVSIGLCKSGGGYNEDHNRSNFVNGAVNFATGGTGINNGLLNAGWTGVDGLGSFIEHELKFGGISKAVGVTSAGTAGEATYANTTSLASWDGTTGLLITANGTQSRDGGSVTGTISSASASLAVVNSENLDTRSDLVYFHLGVAPNKTLEAGSNVLYVVVQVQGSQTLGIGAALHVAYRMNNGKVWNGSAFTPASGNYTDVDVFGESNTYNSLATGTSCVSVTVDDTIKDAIKVSDGWKIDSNGKMDGGAVVPIRLELEDISDPTKLDQVELIIYIAGADYDACDAAVSNNATVKIGLFFGAQEVE